jgi:hypothetical protein
MTMTLPGAAFWQGNRELTVTTPPDRARLFVQAAEALSNIPNEEKLFVGHVAVHQDGPINPHDPNSPQQVTIEVTDPTAGEAFGEKVAVLQEQQAAAEAARSPQV